ncbi:hypothetical protein [Nocardioides sp. NPDC006273]|uniref:hypothetical protein n=1 Tax=Nocardioides sp. NPDC006273 TaxID=3155598 RepID=UPI0033B893B4
MNEPKASPAKSKADADDWRLFSENYGTFAESEPEEVDLSLEGVRAWMHEALAGGETE